MSAESFHRGDTENTEGAEEFVDFRCTELVIAAAIEVHRMLGPGLLESVYQRALAHEISLRGCQVAVQCPVPVRYKGLDLGAPLALDLVVDQRVIVEIKSVRALEDVHRAQLLTYLRLTEMETGLLINFNVPVLKQGIKRVVNSRPSEASATSAFSAPLR